MNRKVKEKTKGPNGVNDGVVGKVGCVLVLEFFGGGGGLYNPPILAM